MKRALSITLWFAAATLFFGLGWLGKSLSPSKELGQESGTVKLRQQFAARGHPLLEGKADIYLYDSQGNVLLYFRMFPDSTSVETLTVYGGNKKPAMYSLHYRSGAVKEIHVFADKQPVQCWGLYEDGRIEFVSQFSQRIGHVEEVRQYYDREGKPTEKHRIGHISE